jgi:YfiH family protein
LADRSGTQVAAIHAGWRGLLAGIIPNTVDAFVARPNELIAWIGPAITTNSYRVEEALRARFVKADESAAKHFRNYGTDWYLDLAGLAYGQLERIGVRSTTSSQLCVYEEQDLFYSYRRDGTTGRMAALIWISLDS